MSFLGLFFFFQVGWFPKFLHFKQFDVPREILEWNIPMALVWIAYETFFSYGFPSNEKASLCYIYSF